MSATVRRGGILSPLDSVEKGRRVDKVITAFVFLFARFVVVDFFVLPTRLLRFHGENPHIKEKNKIK